MRLTQVLQCCWIFLAVAEACSNWFPDTFGADLFRVSWSGDSGELKEDWHGDPEEKYLHEYEEHLHHEEHAGEHEEHAHHAEHASEGEHQTAPAEGEHASPASPYEGGHPISYEGDLAPLHEGAPSEHEGAGHLRRLRSETPGRPWWQRATEVKATWPHGIFFRAVALASLPESGLLATTAFTLYRSSEPRLGQSLSWQALPRPEFPASAAICDAGRNGSQEAASRCLMIAPRSATPALVFWSFGSPEAAVELPLSPRLPPWKTAAGAALPCDKLQFLAHADAQRCLLLAGWDDARLRVAVVKLQDGGLLPSPDTQVAVRSEVPLGSGCGKAPDALHVDATGRLWLSEGGALAAWHLPSGAFLGRWQPSWRSFRPSALCTWGGRLLVAGAAGPGFGRPALLSFRPNLTESQSAPNRL